MTSLAETTPEPRKDWVAPELKKINVEDITALNSGLGDDGFTPAS
jgi:hypothetical protein